MNFKWPTKNAPPATAEEFRLQASTRRHDMAVREPEMRAIREALPGLLIDPTAYNEAAARLESLEALDRSDQRAIELIEVEIPKAEVRERRAVILARRDELERATAKLAKGLPARYEAAAKALAEILKQMDDNLTAWRRMSMDLREIGESRCGAAAEARAREATGTPKISDSRYIAGQSSVLGWDGRTLFAGDMTN